MKIRKIIKNLTISTAFAAGLQCSSPTEPDPMQIKPVMEQPTITGFYVTTLENPDGTGEVIGNPAYKVKEINVFPNPCRTTAPPRPRYGHPLIAFTHLSDTAVIIIVRGRTIREAANTESSILGIPAVHFWPPVVRRIEKSSFGDFCAWDLKDNKGNYAASGYYRAYIYGPKVPPDYFLDFALEIEESHLEYY
ncbi:MAG: hypothetical protein ACM34O_15610 [Ignavibacteria bacterium]